MTSQASVAWVPCNSGLDRNRLFNLDASRDNALERFVEAHQILLENGLKSCTFDLCDLSKTDVVIFYGLSTELRFLIKAIKANPQVRFINIPIEPPVVSAFHEDSILSAIPFDRILVWNDDLVSKGGIFVKAQIGEPTIAPEMIPEVSYSSKRFLVAITSSKLIKHKNGIHEERYRAFDFFSRKPVDFDLFGSGWDKVSLPFVQNSYRGLCTAKKDVLQNYKFSICFENAKDYPGLITEKIFDCFAAGTVPVYYGPPNVQRFIPESCFINFCRFPNYEKLYQYLVNMSEEEYNGYLAAAKSFIQSKEYYEFTSKRYAEIVLEQVQSLLNEPAVNRTVLSFKWELLKIVLAHPHVFLRNIKQCRHFLFDLFLTF